MSLQLKGAQLACIGSFFKNLRERNMSRLATVVRHAKSINGMVCKIFRNHPLKNRLATSPTSPNSPIGVDDKTLRYAFLPQNLGEMPIGRGVLMRGAISQQSKQSPSNKAFRKY